MVLKNLVSWWYTVFICISFIPIFPFGLYEGTNSEAYVEALNLNFLDEPDKIISSLEVVLVEIAFRHLLVFWPLIFRICFMCFDKRSYETRKSIYLALDRLMNIPKYIGLYHIKSAFLSFSNEFWPHLQCLRTSRNKKNLGF